MYQGRTQIFFERGGENNFLKILLLVVVQGRRQLGTQGPDPGLIAWPPIEICLLKHAGSFLIGGTGNLILIYDIKYDIR